MSKKWIELDDKTLRIPFNEDYICIDLGIQTIDPQLIVVLSRTLKEVRLERLRNSIQKNGWLNFSPNALDLILLADGKYAVGRDGNHRAFMSNELGISTIQATISTYVKKDRFTEEELLFIEKIESMQSELYRRITKEKDSTRKSRLSKEIIELNKQLDLYKRETYYRISG